MKKALAIMIFAAMSTTMAAQTAAPQLTEQQKRTLQNGWLNHLDVAFSIGTTGLGFDLSAPMTDWARVRIGAMFMPKFDYTAKFSMEVGETGTAAEKEARFQKLADLMENFCGTRPENSVDMAIEPTMNNFKFLVDVFPLKNNRHWHVTAGFYLGSGTLGKAYNTTECMSSLVAVSMYNSMYKRAEGWLPLIQYGDISIYNEQVQEKLLSYGAVTIPLGEFTHDIIATEDVYYDHRICDENGMPVHMEGTLKYAKGDVMYHKGDTYRMTTDQYDMVRANAKVNKFKPYLGIGYNGAISNDGRTTISADAGVLFWGGKPSVITQTPSGIDADGNTTYLSVDMMRDLTNIPGKVGDYVDLASKLAVYPVISIRIAQRLF